MVSSTEGDNQARTAPSETPAIDAAQAPQTANADAQNVSKGGLGAVRVVELSFPEASKQDEGKESRRDQPRRKVKATFARSSVEGKTLNSLRDLLKTQKIVVENFCYLDGTAAEGDTLLDTYTSIVGQSDHKEKGANPVFIRGPSFKVAEPKSPADVLSTKPFLIKVIQWQAGDGGTVKSSIHSNTLDAKKQDVRSLNLAALRALVAAMSTFKHIHKFCSPSGTTVEDETIRFEDYLALDPKACVEAANGPEGPLTPVSVVKLFYKENDEKNNPPDIPENIKADLTVKETTAAQADKFTPKEKKSLIDAESKLTVTAGSKSSVVPSMLTEAQWDLIMRNCGVLYGWCIDRRSSQIKPAPKQAFRIRSKEHTIYVPATQTQKSADSKDKTSTSTSTSTSKPKEPVPKPEGQSSNANVKDEASKKEGSLKDSSSTTQVVQQRMGVGWIPPEFADPNPPPEPTKKPQESSSSSSSSSSPPPPPPPAVPLDSSTISLIRDRVSVPNFKVNDDSKIEITACEHEFEVSMAKNDFSSHTVEASLSGGYAGWEASVSAGFSMSKGTTSKETGKKYTKTMVARFLYPRCDLLFDASDLEPTEEFKAAIERVENTLNINDLRKLHAEYGHLFCRRVTIGGRLITTKIMEISESSKEDTMKEDFKTSVGVSIKTPVGVGGSAKHESQTSGSTAQNQTQIDRNESHVFEAVGGDTILANNPAEWAPTVGDFKYWRVINRESLSPLIDILTSIPNYGHVKNLFIRAVPVLDSFATLNEDHTVIARMNVVAPLNGLSDEPYDQVIYYLGHRPDTASTPKFAKSAGEGQLFWIQVDFEVQHNLFKPASYRAPMLLGYFNNKLKTQGQPNQYGSTYGQDFLEAQWEIIAPFDHALTHGTRVVLKSRPYDSKVLPPHMVVFRNQQGVFLPAMSDNEEVQYWRILKNDPEATAGQHIKDGDEIRLCWTFRDQTTGWRDYVGDVFGRRRNLTPPELLDTVLFLKLPWPRFEKIDSGLREAPPPHAMIMAPIADVAPQTYAVHVMSVDRKSQEQKNYVVQDIVFRIDTVTNRGWGDSGDYMLPDQQPDDTVQLRVRLKGGGMMISDRIFWL